MKLQDSFIQSVRSFSVSSAAWKIGYKKPTTAWSQYLKDNYAQVKASNSSLPSSEINKLVAAKWKEADSVRKQYQDEYEKKLQGFKNKEPEFAYVVKPERPLDVFAKKNSKSIAKELGLKDAKSIAAAVAKLYEELPEAEKEAAVLKYKKQLRKFKRDEDRKNGIKRPLNAYVTFAVEYRKTHPQEGKVSENQLEIAQLWANLPANEKAQYEDAFKKLSAEYLAIKEKNKVKRPASRYAAFVKEKFPEFKNSYPESSNTEIIKLIAQEWNNVKDYI